MNVPAAAGDAAGPAGWLVVSTKDDWKAIFRKEPKWAGSVSRG